MSNIVVVGGGAAGMMGALIAAEGDNHVVLLEKNEKLGKKLFITGKGRCNITNDCDVEELLKNVVTNEKFLYSSLYGFDSQTTQHFFEKLGVQLKIERGNRVFPASDHSSDVIKVLQNAMIRQGVEIRTGCEVTKILTEEKQGVVSASGVVLADGKKIQADKILLATGGISYPLTGSTGEGHKIAERTGHTVTEMFPALVPLKIREEWCHTLMGLSLKNVKVSFGTEKKQIYEEFGEMLFTHYGVSGPIVISASSYLTQKLKSQELTMYIDLKPALSTEQLDRRIQKDFEENLNKNFKNAVTGLFPAKLTPVMIMLSGIPAEKKVNEITREERKNFVDLIKKLPLTVTGTADFNEAIITQGGVSVKDVNPSTMESKKVHNLFFAGEIMDLDALTGGYNLQIAWSTAFLAAENMKQDEK